MTGWTQLADALLHRQALLQRVGRGTPPDELAGLRIGDDEIDTLLADISGVDTQPRVADLEAKLTSAVDDARAEFRDGLPSGSPLAAVATNAGLAAEEAEVLAMAAAIELEPRRQRVLAYIQDDVTKTRLTLHGLASLFGPEHAGVLAVAPDSALRRAALVTVSEEGPWATHAVAVAPAVTWALVGDGSADPALPLGVTVVEAPAEGDAGPLVLVTGDDRSRRREAAVLRTWGTRFVVSPVPASEEAWAAVVREATLLGAGVVIELEAELPDAGRRWIERAAHLAWALTAKHEIPLESVPRRPWQEFHAPALEPTDAEWKVALGADVPRSHPLTADQLHLVRDAYRGHEGDLDAAVRRLASGHIDQLATRIRPSRSWDDLVLPEDGIAQLRELVDRYRHAERVYVEWGFSRLPTTGLVALFSGRSGTGKTLAAEIVAGDLGLDLFKLDLSAVVSKYIGETEKNLDKVFDAAAAGNVVLFFDEADALFGKRSEVKDARDRYANIEVSYLLQRLESYGGIVVMATNFQKNIDDAFRRRIHLAMEFPMPEQAERMALWKLSFPDAAPTDGIDFEFLAQNFELSGGSIRNAALQSAFLAAALGDSVTMETVMRGLKREYQKLGRLLRAEEFGPYYELLS